MIRTLIAGSFFVGLVINGTASFAENLTSATIQFQADTVHFELAGHQNWEYDLKKNESKGSSIIEMTVPAVDDATAELLGKFTSEIVSKVRVDRKGKDGASVIYFTLAGNNIETFDYLTDQPSRLIVDFYVHPNAKAAKNNGKEKTQSPGSAEKSPVHKTTAKLANKQPESKGSTEVLDPKNRNPATADFVTEDKKGYDLDKVLDESTRKGIFDGGDPDYERFTIKPQDIKEEAIIRSKDNIYMNFPMLENPVEIWEKLKVTPSLYEISPTNTDENKQMRLLLTLFEKKRYGVFLKTKDWFKEKYPKSQYSEICDFMTADVLLALSGDPSYSKQYDESIQKYKEAMEKYPHSPLTERTSIKIGFLTLEHGNGLAALRLFKEHIENKNFGNDSVSKDLARLGMGLAYMKMNRWDDAQAAYDDLEKNSRNRGLKVEAAYRKGDVWVKAKKYSRAVEEYQKALKKYPEDHIHFPNAYYNQAQSLFSMQKYPESLDLYREYIKKFPSNDHAAYALTRIGELLEILGADKSRVIGAYLETYFRYNDDPSVIIARLRLLSARMKGMRPKETGKAVEEIMTLAKKSNLPNIEQFATVMVADGYTQKGEFDKSIDLLSKYYKDHPITEDLSSIVGRIIGNINGKLRTQIADGDFVGALKTHNKFADNWLKNTKRLDMKYFIGRAFEMAGVPTESEKYYKDVLNRVYSLRGTAEGKEIKLKENLPSEDQINLRLSATSMNQKNFSQAYEYLRNIKEPGSMSDAEQIERVDIAVRLLEKRGETETAVRYLGDLLRTWKGQPEMVAEAYLKMAELQMKQKRSNEALKALKIIDNMAKDSDHVPGFVHAKALEMMADIYMDKGNQEQAIASYRQLLEKFENSRPLASMRFKLGQIYFKQGALQQAADTWHDFKGEKSSFWKNLAQEQLKNSDWHNGYKKYIQRIPAMSKKENK